MITKLKEEYVKQVARMHKKELSGFLPELGEEFLALFYKTSLGLPEMFTFVEEEKGKVLGFVTGVTTTKNLYKKIILRKPLKFSFIFWKYIISHPAKVFKIFKIVTYPGFAQDHPELLTIAVSQNYRLKGIGLSLFRKCAGEFKKRKIDKFKISVYDRLPANGFYQKIGCRLESSFDFLGEKMNYYVYKTFNI